LHAGYDLELLKQMAERVPVPVIASGGAGRYEHFKDALTLGRADGVLAASLFHDRQMAIADLKLFLQRHKIPVRL
jgi:cyclase